MIALPNQSILHELAHAARVSPTESDRLASLRYTFQLAVELFECEALAAQWMQLPHAELAGLKPLECLDTDQGHDRIRTLLMRAIHGICA
ncbi:antitoxin Xre/MbcA/ParS toxin-binding domain-containing protein [Burkholderia lata]|uniref:antitoxin Xre/MbcA/ParS toxin-binding domain-containing protein n=1 Tax=Burkholderia lata (strain ATCC 17760 / DSM 23089 / LMG 22485 / NCIMB 9086 / R18194 / 383) TaxID=482957 RepID=UPI00158353FA|nr:antitoxin Xre/MbcA/ParS toxin-binding domain-containing protein [Burkholderia lata]